MVFFLFPGLFLYDSSLGLGADHVLAFWAVPLALAVRRLLHRPTSAGRAMLVGLMMAGAPKIAALHRELAQLQPAARFSAGDERNGPTLAIYDLSTLPCP